MCWNFNMRTGFSYVGVFFFLGLTAAQTSNDSEVIIQAEYPSNIYKDANIF